MEDTITISYKYLVQIKTYLSYKFSFTFHTFKFPFFMVGIDNDKFIIINNITFRGLTNNSLASGGLNNNSLASGGLNNNSLASGGLINNNLYLSDKILSNLRIGSSRKPRTSEKDAKYKDYKNVNVTSVVGSSFSPLKGETYPITTFDGLVYQNFENWWQSSKIYPDLNHYKNENLTEEFFEWRKQWSKEKQGCRILRCNKNLKKCLKSTSKSLRQLCYKPIAAYHDGEIVDYITSRDFYLREYINVIKNKKYFNDLYERVKNGEKIMILDLDGPLLDLYPEGREVSWNMIQEAMNDPKYPFGHGYVICCLLLLLCTEELLI